MDKEKQEQNDLIQIIAAQRDSALNNSAVLQVKLNAALRDVADLTVEKEKWLKLEMADKKQKN